MTGEERESAQRLFLERLLRGGRQEPPCLPEWLLDDYITFRKNVLDQAYPCYFGTIAERKGDLYYAFVEGLDLKDLPAILRQFIAVSAETPKARNNLAVFFGPEREKLDHQGYYRKFWEVLSYLHACDSEPWPAETPTDSDDPYWEFTFGGSGFFVFAAAPSYRLRRSRHLGDGMVLLFQPRDAFSGIEGNTEEGRFARDKVRERLRQWDQVAPHPELGWLGDPDNREWKQYFLADDQSPAPGRCPMDKKSSH